MRRFSVAVDDDELAETSAQSGQVEALVVAGVRDLRKEDGVVIGKDGLRLLERDPVFAPILPRLARVPIEAEIVHSSRYVRCTYIARTTGRVSVGLLGFLLGVSVLEDLVVSFGRTTTPLGTRLRRGFRGRDITRQLVA